jgi:flagellar biogenesis protein FliO
MLTGLYSGKYGFSLAITLSVAGVLLFGEPLCVWADVPSVSSGDSLSTMTDISRPTLLASTLKMLGGLCFCLGLLALGVRIMKKMPGCQSPLKRRRLEIREKLALSSKAALYVVAVDNREYLIASGSDSTSITPTHTLTTPLFAESLDEVYEESGALHA